MFVVSGYVSFSFYLLYLVISCKRDFDLNDITLRLYTWRNGVHPYSSTDLARCTEDVLEAGGRLAPHKDTS